MVKRRGGSIKDLDSQVKEKKAKAKISKPKKSKSLKK